MPRTHAPVVGMLVALASCGDDPQEPHEAGSLRFDNAWVRPPVAGRTTTAAYFDVTNPGDVAIVVTGFASENPDLRVELHETTQDGGMMRMRSLGRVTIPPNSTVSFAPGGKHLMLFGFDGAAGDVTLAATLHGGKTLPVVFATRFEAD